MEKCKYYKYGSCSGQKNFPCVDCKGDKLECEINETFKTPNTPEGVFKRNLKLELKKKIKDYPKIYFVDGVLLVEFYHLGNLSISYIETNIYNKMEAGIDTKSLALKIYNWYKSIILTRYFNE